MTAVWYLGRSDTRTITGAQWTAAGIAGSPATTTWNAANGWSIPAGSFTGPQLTILDADDDFNISGADGPRPGAAASSVAARAPVAPIWRPRDTLTGPVATGVDNPTMTTGLAADGNFNEQYILGSNLLPAIWPVDMWGQHLPITANTFVAKTSQGTVATICTNRMMTDADEFYFFSYGAGTFGIDLFIDGKPFASNPILPQSSTGFAPYGFTKLLFGSAKPRLIELRTMAGLVGVYVKKPYRVWKPSAENNPKIAVVGDSYVAPAVMNDASAGSVTADSYRRGAWQKMAEDLGLMCLQTDGIGGTGYIAGGGPGRPYSHADRVAWLQALNPDVIVYHGGGANDRYNAYDNATIISAVVARFKDARLKHPDAKLVFVEGFAPPSHPFSADYPVIRAGVQAALDIKGVYYLDIATTRPPISGTGYVTAPDGVPSNSNIYIGSDQAHLTVKGNDYVRRVLANKMRRVLADDGRLDGSLIL